MKRGNSGLKALILLMLCVLLCSLCAAAAASGVETDEEGGTWDYNKGIYTDPTGAQHQITSDGVDSSGSGSSGSSSVTTNGNGAMIIDTGEKDDTAGAKKNADGSIEVNSGELGVDIEISPTRAPLTKDEWVAEMNRVAAANGKDTPAVWTDPATGNQSTVEVVYMGIGRSMIKVDGQKKLVNTVDLKWETEAPEDKVLAVVRSRQIWLRKNPSNDKKNIKFKQVYRDSVVRVLAVLKRGWTFVDHDGDRGYVKTSTLEFFANDHTSFENGYLSLNGKIKGKGRVQVRNLETRKILTGFQPGTPVTVFDILEDQNFAEIDVEGLHCVVNLKCLTLERNLAGASAAQ